MKRISLIIIGALAVSTFFISSCNNASDNKAKKEIDTLYSIPEGSIVYFSLDRVIEEYDMANDLRSEVQAKVEVIQKDLDRRQKNLENAIKTFENKINKGLMTSAVAADQQRKLQEQQASFNQYAQQKQGEIMEEQQVMMNQISDAIKTFVDEYNDEKGYAMILTNQAGMPVVTADPYLDVTNEIIEGLNKKYVEEKARNNN